MKFNYKSRGFFITVMSLLLVAVGVVNYQLSKKSLMGVSEELKAYEQAQIDKNSEETTDEGNAIVVDSKENEVTEKVTETSKEIEKQLTSESNMKKSSYILDMKMTREKQRNELTQDLNEMINNPSTTEEARTQASDMKLEIVKAQETELQIENLLSTKGFVDALVYINKDKVNVVVNEENIEKEDAAKIFDLIAEQANVKYENIKLMNNSN